MGITPPGRVHASLCPRWLPHQPGESVEEDDDAVGSGQRGHRRSGCWSSGSGMGNSLSARGQPEAGGGLAARNPDFAVYCTSAWRSERARELDSLGGARKWGWAGDAIFPSCPVTSVTPHVPSAGLGRQPVRRGASFSAKLHLLGVRLCLRDNRALYPFSNWVLG